MPQHTLPNSHDAASYERDHFTDHDATPHLTKLITTWFHVNVTILLTTIPHHTLSNWSRCGFLKYERDHISHHDATLHRSYQTDHDATLHRSYRTDHNATLHISYQTDHDAALHFRPDATGLHLSKQRSTIMGLIRSAWYKTTTTTATTNDEEAKSVRVQSWKYVALHRLLSQCQSVTLIGRYERTPNQKSVCFKHC